MTPLQAALHDADTLVARDNWVRIVSTDRGVEMDYGRVYTNGFRELAIATRIYAADGTSRTLVHR